MEALDFKIDVDLPGETGSWWKRFWVKSKDAMKQEEVQERLIKIERMAETKFFEKPQAEANKDYATAVQLIMKSIDKVDTACIQIGNILLVKHSQNHTKKEHSTHIVVRTLNPIEMKMLEKNQSLLKTPANILERLEVICGDDPENT